MLKNILDDIALFSEADKQLFEKLVKVKRFSKNEILLKEGEVCRSVFYVISGSCYQFQITDVDEIIIDLHLLAEWVFEHASLSNQVPSQTSIKMFENSEILELSLENLHKLISQSQSFLQFGKIFSQPQARTFMFDNSLSPSQKYNYINTAKPLISQVFPVKMIASYLKIAPETLSRVRSNY